MNATTEYTLTGMTAHNMAMVAAKLSQMTIRHDGGRSDAPVSVTVGMLTDRTIWTMTKAQRIGVKTVIVTIVH